MVVVGSSHGYRAGDPEYRRISAALFLAAVATFALLYAPQPLLPVLAADFAVSAGRATLAVSAATAALAVGVLIAAPVSERVGRTRFVHGSLVTSAVLGLACLFAPTWPVLELLRAGQGLALAGLPAVAVAYLREELHPSASGPAIALYIGGNALGGMVGRLLAAGLSEAGGWRPALAGVSALGLLVAVAVWRLLPSSARFVAAPAGFRPLARRTAAVLSDPALLALYGLAFTLMAAFFAVWNVLGFRLADAPYTLSPGLAGLVFAVYAIGSFASAVAGRLAERLGRRSVVAAAVVLLLAGLVLTLAAPLWVVVVGTAVLTAGFFAAHGVASGWVASRAEAAGRSTGQAASIYLVSYYVGSSVGGSAGGVVWGAGRWPAVVAVAAGFALLALALTLALRTMGSLAPPADGPHDAWH